MAYRVTLIFATYIASIKYHGQTILKYKLKTEKNTVLLQNPRCKIDINNHIDFFVFCYRMITVPKNTVIINKTKVLLPHAWVSNADLGYPF
jgi:hypothetical protein